MPRPNRSRPPDPLPLVILVGVVLVLLLGWWLFPRIQNFMSYQDCVATGRTNCAPVRTPEGGSR